MRKSLIPLIILLLSLIGNNTFAQFAGGTGTAGDPYRINNVTQLNYFSSQINGTNSANYIGKYFKLTANLSGINTFIPIGNSIAKSFQGHFDGDGHTVTNLNINSGTYIGLFGYISNATIEKVGVIDGNISPTTDGYAGGLVGYAVNSTISQCFSKVSFSINYTSTSGGLIGRVNNSVINNCFFTLGNVNLNVNNINTYVGGLIGYIENNSVISNCFSSPANFTNRSISGPLYGYCSSDSPINNCYFYNNWNAQTYGTPINAQADMATYDFAVALNACQSQTWRKIPNYGSTSYYPTLYWQVPPDWENGTEIPGCGLDGEGTSTNPFRIRWVKDLISLSNAVNNLGVDFSGQYLIVENNISFTSNPSRDSSQYFNPIGNSTNSFQGIFNGGEHKITNITKSGNNYIGLFGNILNARIESLGIEGTFTSNNYGGALVANASNSNIKKCYSISTLTGSANNTNCRIGGLIGNVTACLIDNSYSRVTINNSGSGTDQRYYGGFIGYIDNNSTISNCYTASTVFNVNRDGALIGNGNTSIITNSYYLDISNMNQFHGDPIADLTTMRAEQFAIDLNNCQTQTWKWANNDNSINNGLPVLYWQGLGVDLPSCFNNGDGTEDNPYRIRYVIDLIRISNLVSNGTSFSNVYFIVENNISFTTNPSRDSSQFFLPIGNRNFAFQGNFNGNGKVISNLTITSTLQDIGLFGKVENNATIKNLGIEGANITLSASSGTNNYHAAGLVGHIGDNTTNLCTISGCYVSSSTIKGYGTKSTIAGLVGYAGKTKIENCYSRANIIQGDYNTQYTNTNNFYGGLVGYINNNSTILNSYSAPNSFTTRTNNKGLLAGQAENSVTITNSYYDNTISSNGYNSVGESKLVNELKSGCFVVTLNNIQNPIVWFKAKRQANEGYPVLSWQKLSDTITPAGFEGNCLGVTYAGGTQTTQYKIRYIKDLIYISNMVVNDTNYLNKYFQIQNDINFTDSSIYYNPIGNSNNNCFSGNFDGNEKIISNITISENDSVGLFGCISGATIYSLGIANSCSFTSNINGGSLAGYAYNSTIYECYTLASLTGNATNSKIGGLVGYMNGASIKNCYCRNSITNSSNGSSSGGIVCSIDNNSFISDSYSSPVSFPTDGARGILVGSITNCTNPNINSYYDNTFNVSGMTIFGTSKTLAQMRTLDFAMDLSACQIDIWKWADGNNSINNGLPVFNWQVGTTLPYCGSSDYPFRIRCVADLVTLSNNVNNNRITYLDQYFLVENDIDFNNDPTGDSDDFEPIGKVELDVWGDPRTYIPFSGNINGGGHVIKNLNKSGSYIGLFGYITGATIENLGIDNFTLTSNRYGGGLVAYANSSTIRNSFSVSSLTGSWYNNNIYLGGLMGYSNSCTISNCYSRATINCSYSYSDWNFSGGLIGYIENGSISDSYSAPLSISYGDYGGSLVGYINNNPIFNNSYYLNLSGMNINYGIAKDSNQMRSGCFVVTLNNSQSPVAWFKAKSQVNLGYPVLSWQKLSDNITPAGFEGNCLVTNDGSSTNPYQIKYVKDLIYISNMVANDTTYSGEYFKVLNDINYNNGVIDSSSLFNPIGVYSNNKPFSGNFNGQRFAIANYSFSDTTKNNIGFFGYTNLATIQRLGISNINICAKDTVGGLVANADSTKIGGCFVYGYIKGKNSVGGLVGVGTGATSAIDTSFTNTSIDAQTNVGGLVGNHNGGTINNSYSNSEIYSSTSANNYVGGIIGNASSSSNLTNVYSVCKIIRNGTNTNFGKIKGNSSGTNTNCYSRDSVFVNYTNSNTTGYNGTQKTNGQLRSSGFVTELNNAIWQLDYNDSINDGYPIFTYQSQAVKPNSSGLWPTTTASQVVIIKSGVQLKANSTYFPKCAYVKIEAGGELNNTTNINLFGEYNRELYAGKWNLIGLSTYNQTLASLYNYADTSFKTFVKEFDYITNNWSTTTTQGVNTKFEIGEGILVMPNYSLDDQKTIKTRIVSKGVLYNDTTYQVPNPTTSAGRFVSLANNYPASLTVTQNDPPISGNTAGLIQGNLVYIYDADSGKWNNNFNTNVRVTSIKPGEGFFIAASSTGGNFLFEKSQIRNTSGAKNTIKSDLIYVQAIADSNVRESFLEFNEEADNGFDFEDGLMLFGNNYNSVEPFFTIPTPEINASATQLIKDAFSSLPYTTELDLRSQKNNEVTLNFSNIPSNIHVYLLDSLLNKAQYLNEEPNYNLQVNEGDNAKRLYVLFSYYKEDINEFFKPEVAQEIKIWNYNNNLNIEGRDLIRYELFDIMGNKLLVEDILDDKFKTQLDLGSGIYIVRAFSSSSSKAQKISISRK